MSLDPVGTVASGNKENPFLQLEETNDDEAAKKNLKVFEVFLATAMGSIIFLSCTLSLNYIGIISSIIASKLVAISTLVSTVSGVAGTVFYFFKDYDDDEITLSGIFFSDNDQVDFEKDIENASLFYEEKKVLAPLKEDRMFPVGLKNIGNNCFINAMWQVLMADEIFINKVMNIDIDEKVIINEKEEAKYTEDNKKHIKILKNLIFDYREAQNEDGQLGTKKLDEEYSQRIRRLLVNLAGSNKMSLSGQEDAIEPMNLINGLVYGLRHFSEGMTQDRCFVSVPKDSAIRPIEIKGSQIKLQETITTKEMHDDKEVEIECDVYFKLTRENEEGDYFSLGITDIDFNQMFDNYFNEKSDGREVVAFRSEGSDKEEENYHVIRREKFFTKTPNSLNIQFKRFKRIPRLKDGKQVLDKKGKPKFILVKITDTIKNIPDLLGLPTKSGHEEYEMTAKIFHRGFIKGGHYVSCVGYKNKEGKYDFFFCNDGVVEKVDPEKMQKDTYLVRYNKKAR